MRAIVLLIGLGLIAPLAGDLSATRVRCKQGCDSFYCRKKTCGEGCKAGPNCSGCWKTAK